MEMGKIAAFGNMLLVLFILIVYGCSKHQFIIKDNTARNDFKIIKIEEHDMFYIIYTRRNDSVFKIIEDKFNLLDSVNYQKIRRGRRYNLFLEDFNKWSSESGKSRIYRHVTLQYYGVLVPSTKKNHFILYDAINLDEIYIRLPQDTIHTATENN
jgi:hypothetical protein